MDTHTSAQLALELRKVSVEGVLLVVVLQLALIIGLARIFALLFRKLGQPSAVGEIVAGLLLGPSFFQAWFPQWHQAIFHPHVHGVSENLAPIMDSTLEWIFRVLAQTGLILLLFLVGLEFDFSHLRMKGKAAAAISLSGILLPFLLGILVAYGAHAHLEPHPVSGAPVPFVPFTLFMGVAMSITALPILGRIMMELDFAKSRLGAITISAAAIDDAMGWILLALVAAIVRGEFVGETKFLGLELAPGVGKIGLMIALTLGFAALMILVAGPILRRWASWAVPDGEKPLSISTLTVTIVLLFLCSLATNAIGIFAIFGAFLFGAALSPCVEFHKAASRGLRDFVTAFFLPIFFTYTGLRTNIHALGDSTAWTICGFVMAAAMIGKFGGCGIAAKLTGFSLRESMCIGVMMNTRALMELIVINVGYELGAIPQSVFTMLVLMALLTTVITTPILLLAARGTEIESSVFQSELARQTIWLPQLGGAPKK